MTKALRNRSAVFVAAAIVVCFASVLAQQIGAADPPANVEKPRDASALDDSLLKDLDNELLNEAGDLKDRPAKRPQQGGAADKPLDESAIDGEDIGMPSAENDPLAYISEEMRSVESLIPERSKRQHVEVSQRRIVEDLARLIEQAEQQRAAQQQAASSKGKKQQSTRRQSVEQPKSRSGGKTGKESNKPAQDSTDRLGKAADARPDAELVRGLMKDTWGHLPERAREQMLQTSPERFLPRYELLIERYYKRLAEEQNSR